jgi:hypothetical protein
VNQYNAGWGYGWGTDGTLLMGRSQLSAQQQKERYIDLIDAKKKRTSVEGQGVGYLTQNREQKKN